MTTLCHLGIAYSALATVWTLLPTKKVGGLTFKRIGSLSLSYCLTRK